MQMVFSSFKIPGAKGQEPCRRIDQSKVRKWTHILRLPPGSVVTLTKLPRNNAQLKNSEFQQGRSTHRRLYRMRFLARPLGVFFFSCLSTFGVCDLTLPARARDPWTVHQYSVNDVRSDEEGVYCTFSHIVLEVGVVDEVDDEKWS